jgi:hypothetical protein
MNGRCLVPRCGAVGPIHWHHLTGRGPDDRYCHPDLTISLCPECHQPGIHRLLQIAGLDGPMEATPGVLVGRVAANFGWLGWDRTGTVELRCDLLAGIADVLGDVGRQLRRAGGTLP